jgi:hypothetical protein
MAGVLLEEKHQALLSKFDFQNPAEKTESRGGTDSDITNSDIK